MRENRWFEIGEIAELNKNMRAKGFMLTVGTKVKIVNHHKISIDSGSYSYDIEVINPKTNELVILNGWVSQFDLKSRRELEESNQMKEKNRFLDDELERLKKEIEKQQNKK